MPLDIVDMTEDVGSYRPETPNPYKNLGPQRLPGTNWVIRRPADKMFFRLFPHNRLAVRQPGWTQNVLFAHQFDNRVLGACYVVFLGGDVTWLLDVKPIPTMPPQRVHLVKTEPKPSIWHRPLLGGK